MKPRVSLSLRSSRKRVYALLEDSLDPVFRLSAGCPQWGELSQMSLHCRLTEGVTMLLFSLFALLHACMLFI